MLLLHTEGEITARRIAERLGVTERTVRRILSDLEKGGYIERQRVGRANRYRVDLEKSLKRSDQRSVTVGELLKIMQVPRDA